MVEVIWKKRKYLVPENWDEVSSSQFLAIVKVLQSGMELLKGKMCVLQALLGMPYFRFFKIKDELLMHLLPLTDWVESNGKLNIQLVPAVKLKETLYGPKGNLHNIRAGEFHFADMHYTQWKEGEKLEALYMFVAVLYRPAKKQYDLAMDPDGDIRIPFNPNTTQYYADHVKVLSPVLIHAITLCYEAWRRNMEEDHPRIFSPTNKKTAANYGWFPVFRGIAGGSQYGTLEEVEQMYIQTLLLELELLKDEEIELRKKHPELFKTKN
jgi:hypothetical protein